MTGRVLLDTGMRVSELVGLELEHVDREQAVLCMVGRGGRGRACPYGTRTAEELRRYLRARARHSAAASHDRLWIGRQGPMSYTGIKQMLDRRGKDAGVDNVHPHRFRHTFSHRWLADGGQEQDLMRLAAGGRGKWSPGTRPAPPTSVAPDAVTSALDDSTTVVPATSYLDVVADCGEIRKASGEALWIVEDSAGSFLASGDRGPACSGGDVSVASIHASKIVAAVEEGLIFADCRATLGHCDIHSMDIIRSIVPDRFI